MSYLTWGTTSASTYISNDKIKPASSLKGLLKKHEEVGIKLVKKVKKEDQKPVLFDPKDLVL